LESGCKVVLFVTAALVSLTYGLFSDSLPRIIPRGIALYWYCGGVFIAFYVLSITWTAPRFGIGNAISFVLLGQLIAIALMDHYQWLGAVHVPLDRRRIVGLALMAAGAFLVARR
jgi:bacterial/archaeal transporter family-2 protein